MSRTVVAWLIITNLACMLAACTPVIPTMAGIEPTASPQSLATATLTPPDSPTATATSTVTAAPATLTPAAAPLPALCSPLEDIPLEELGLSDLLKGPFIPPSPGIDDGHHGVDFAYWSRGEHQVMLGLPVKAALSGRIAAVLPERQPYGNAVIVETRLGDLPQGWLAELALPTPAPTQPPGPSLICPAASEVSDLSASAYPQDYSLYLLYGHLNEPSPLTVDQLVTCGQEIGKVGTTGRSVNAHLHLETRLGPAGATFMNMAHYQNDASEIEMGNYCAWRVSGLFLALDPMRLLSLQP